MYSRRCTHGFFILFSNLEQTDTDPAADFGAKCSFTKSGQRDCDPSLGFSTTIFWSSIKYKVATVSLNAGFF